MGVFIKINSFLGMVGYIDEESGYQYSAHRSRVNENNLSYVFMTATTIKGKMGDRTDMLFTADRNIRLYSFIQRLFEKKQGSSSLEVSHGH